MDRALLRSASLALPAMLLSSAAFADLTPAQVWGDWQQYMQGMGYTVSATEAQDGDTLTINDLTLEFPAPEGGDEVVTMQIGTLGFAPAAGGAVEVVMPESLPLTLKADASGDAPAFTMNLTYDQTGQSIMVSGTPEEMTYSYDAATAQMALAELIVDGKSYGDANARMNIGLENVTSSTVMAVAEARRYEQTGQIESLSYDIFVNNPEETGELAMKGAMEALTLEGGGTIPLQVPDAADIGAMIGAGFDVNGVIAYGAGNADVSFKDEAEGDFAATTSSTGGSLAVKMGPEGLTYAGDQSGTQIKMNVADLPFPIELAMGQSGFNLTAPVQKSDDAQGFALGLLLEDFTMSDMIWSIFDPTSQLPRTPATVALDLSGEAKLLVDYMDPEAAAKLSGPPGELQSLKVNKLLVDAAGARLEGTGDVTFDNDAPGALPGMPQPVGSVELALAGGNALLDKLVAMGFVPEQQAMGARMMMGLFAVPGDAPDTLKSKIDFTEDGQILANGQRLK